MARPKRAVPMKQGSLARIYEWFFKPLMHYRPEDMPIKDWMESLFHLKERDLIQYRAKRDFKMPGLYYLRPFMKIQGIGTRQIKEGSLLMVRKDHRDSFWDVEFFGGPGGTDQVFQLSTEEWRSIFPNLEEVPPRGMRKRSRAKL